MEAVSKRIQVADSKRTQVIPKEVPRVFDSDHFARTGELVRPRDTIKSTRDRHSTEPKKTKTTQQDPPPSSLDIFSPRPIKPKQKAKVLIQKQNPKDLQPKKGLEKLKKAEKPAKEKSRKDDIRTSQPAIDL